MTDWKEKLEAKDKIYNGYKFNFDSHLATLTNTVEEIFPHAKISANISKGVGGSFYLEVSFYLISDRNDQSSKLMENDPAYAKFLGHLPENPEDDYDKIKFSIENLTRGISLKPEPGSYMAMQHLEAPYRKSTNTIAKQVDKLIKFFKKHGEAIINNKDNLYRDDIPEKYLTINV